jgi:F1F0 ATPase subunit 2
MMEILYNLLAFLAGGLIGTLFFGGLWITVKEAARSKNPAAWFIGSFVLRMAVAMTGFYFVSHGSWQRAMICLVGFIIARLIVIRHTRILVGNGGQTDKEGNHES